MSFWYAPPFGPPCFSSSTTLRTCAIACSSPSASSPSATAAPLSRAASAFSRRARRATAGPFFLPVASAACCLASSSDAASKELESPKSSPRVPTSERVRRRWYQKRWIGERGT